MTILQQELPEEEWFCCLDCKRIYIVLKDLIVSGAAKLSHSILDITREKLNGKNVKGVIDMDVRWRLIDAKAVSQESKWLLSETLALFHVSLLILYDILAVWLAQNCDSIFVFIIMRCCLHIRGEVAKYVFFILESLA